jgi:predicted enzyme related to lactoylglutathione lyase
MASNGKFVWYDLMTKNEEASLAFYAELIGWKSSTMDIGGMPYTLLRAGETTIGGLMNLDAPDVPNHWVGYVQVEDIEATCALATELGGTVCVPPTEIPGVGRFAVLTDPQGGVISPLQPAAHEVMPEWKPGPGIVAWNEYMAQNVPGAFGFYALLFGWSPAGSMKEGGEDSYFLCGADKEQPCVGMMKAPEMLAGRSAWLFYITVADCAQSVEVAKSRGAQLLTGPMPVPGGQAAVLMDPQGAAFGVYAGTESQS